MKICSKCGKQCDDDSQFCSKCGNELYQVKISKKKHILRNIGIAILVFPLALVFILKIAVSSLINAGNKNKQDIVMPQDTTITTSINKPLEQEENKISKPIVIDANTSTKGYSYIDLNDLDNHAKQIIGEKILTYGTFGDIDDNEIQLRIPDTYHYASFILAKDSKTNLSGLSWNDPVVIIGTVEGETDALLYTYPVIKDCYVVSLNNASYIGRETNSKISSKFELVQDEIDDLPEGEYKDNCKTYSGTDWENIVRNPDAYENKLCKLSGTVSQVIEGWLDTYTIYILDDYGNKWACSYDYKDNESHKLEDDHITVWGNLDGTATASTLLGKQVTMPYIDVAYIK